MTASVSIDRTQLSLTALSLPSYPTADVGLWLPEDGIDRPNFAYRLTYPEDSAYIDGRRPLAAALGDGVFNLIVYARGTDAVTLEAQRALLKAALSQWAYDVTLTIGGVAETYEAWPASPFWGLADSGVAGAFMDKATVAITVNPPETSEES